MLSGALLLCAVAAHADMDSYFTMGVNETVRINPSSLGGYAGVTVRAVFQGRSDFWYMTMDYSGGLYPSSVIPGSGMTVHYLDSVGNDTSYTALLHHDYNNIQMKSTFWSSINIPGYWDSNNDGTYETYGTVKWDAGTYDNMFSISFSVPLSFTSGQTTITGYLNSSIDMRGGTTGYVVFQKTVDFIVGYEPGDVNGDGWINISDLTLLTDYLIGSATLNQYQLDAADVNRDGEVNISDAICLTDILSGSVNSIPAENPSE